ncbi:hypothetical protein [Pelagerythrobacter marensis]|uniref:Uncharacterized protein n=1 Tax=Pelagerythrobacter marensis TaxID=543877 RepID=A0A0G3XE01_9SPHN|nr:hypothetical protein [Pelagerythrobacter marensis]AKM08578.1 hypothetical protein AM2010_2523 [Pelagerythrobacter marensis]
MIYRILTALAVAASFSMATPAIACSVVPGYRVPTNLELAEKAELVLLGRVVGEVEGAELRDRRLLVEPQVAIKGEVSDGPIVIAGVRLDQPLAGGGSGLLSNPYELAEAHPDSFLGACIRRIFPRGTTVLFFLERASDGEGWRPSGGPFSRWAEDVLSEDAPWLTLTQLYVAAAAAPESRRRAMLEAEFAGLVALPADPVVQLIAADIARQLAGPNETWAEVMAREMEAYRETREAVDAVKDAMDDVAEDIPEPDPARAHAMEDGR